jgi:transcription elongation factor
MSTKVGTLQAPRAGGSIVLAAFLASLVMLTIAVVAISLDRDQGRQGETTFVGRHVVNTPSELSGGIVGGTEQTFVGGTAANTPSETRRGIVGRPTPRVATGGNTPAIVSGVNTPSELSGGLFEQYGRHQRI